MEYISTKHYQATKNVVLTELKTYEDFNKTAKQLKEDLKLVRKSLGDFQEKLLAYKKYSVLICLQGMDTSGKDSLIREVFKNLNVNGITVHSFKVPTALELGHDFLWRHYIALPTRGEIGIFNRTHYENVLVTRVHPSYILEELLPQINNVSQIDTTFWQKRFDQINNFEKHLAENGTIIFKFFLHLSKEEQRKRLLRRLQLEEKQWKFSAGDLAERKLWDSYQTCYQEAIRNTTTKHAHWHIIPADNKKAARLTVATILEEQLACFTNIMKPAASKDLFNNINTYKEALTNEAL